jgi:5-methylcytosine-specific restriction endonuclease McrA
MSRDKNYQRLLNSKRWQEVKRIVWQRTNGLCEECMKQGIVRAGVDCHHIVPVETATTPQEMERLCFDVNNVRLLCIACHSAIHKGMGKGTRKLAVERAKQRQDRWAEGLMNRFTTAKETTEADR